MWYVMWKVATLKTRGCCILKLGGKGRGLANNKATVSHAALVEGCTFVVDSRSRCICLQLASFIMLTYVHTVHPVFASFYPRGTRYEIGIAPITDHSLEHIPRFI